ncbi:MAG TPA: M14 family zinc carboxypeptidase [Bryobacteraceae bacterium]|nr:M14 family zinc carboxypeptidase [Bryobacteraceae bacterium]
MRIRYVTLLLFCSLAAYAQKKPAAKTAPPVAAAAAAPQKLDEEYTKLIKQYLQDSRITTELVDHMPASDTVPSPLKFFGRIPGTPGELTYAKDINRYYEALAAASPRAKFWKIGQTEEGRDQVLLAIADEETIKNLDKYKGQLAALTDPRRTTEQQAQELIHTAKPIYWATSGIHSPETGGPEMLIELAYRLIVEETPFIQSIRNNMIFLITPVVEVDGREKQVDTYYYGKKTGKQRPPLMYWGKYVAHDNNRDGMGQYLKLTQNITKEVLEWHPTVLHDLHEAQSYLYVSTGTGPYNNSIDPIQIDEWWLLAETEVMEMAKRGVPGVFTYGFYDGWVPNYLFWIAITHNSFGRFYEVQSYGPDIQENLRLQATATSREWFRPNPPLPSIKWGPRNNTNIQESALLFALHKVAQEKELYLENYWLKNKRSVDAGKKGPTFAWVIPANQRRRADAADMVNALRAQGVEVQVAGSSFKSGGTDVAAGDYIVRADQPYRTVADMYFSVQNYPPANPRPYDDTGWTMQYMRNVKLLTMTDRSVLDQPMSMIGSEVKVPGRIEGSGTTLVIDHTTDNSLMSFRFKNANVKMMAAEDDFDLNGHKFRAGAFIIPDADVNGLRASIQASGLSAWAVATAPTVKTHEMQVPRIGYVHSWQRTQDEGWVRAALDQFGVPYTYFSDQKLRDGGLRAKYDVIIYPHVGGNSSSHLTGIPKVGPDAVPYKKSEMTPNLGALDQSDDIRGGMGIEGLAELAKFVQEGGTLITEGSTSAFVADYGLTSGVTVEHPGQLFARGSILRAQISDMKSPIAYGYDQKDLPVYFNQDPVFSAGGGFGGGGRGGFGGGGGGADVGQNVTPNAVPIHVSPFDATTPQQAAPSMTAAQEQEAVRQQMRAFGVVEDARPRVVMTFPQNPNDMLLSGTLAGGQALSGRAAALDVSLGKGHIVMFALRPFWRWQTQGTYFLGFNAILNWNHLDAGKEEVRPGGRRPSAQ